MIIIETCLFLNVLFPYGHCPKGGCKGLPWFGALFFKVCPGVKGLAGMVWSTFHICPLRKVRLNLSILICVRACCRVKYWSDRLHETGCGVVGSETGIRGPYHLVPAGFCALHGGDSLLPLSDFQALLRPNMALSGSYFHLVFILLPLLISGQVDPVDKAQSSPSGQVDPVDKGCEEGIDCVHKTECETFKSAPSL